MTCDNCGIEFDWGDNGDCCPNCGASCTRCSDPDMRTQNPTFEPYERIEDV